MEMPEWLKRLEALEALVKGGGNMKTVDFITNGNDWKSISTSTGVAIATLDDLGSKTLDDLLAFTAEVRGSLETGGTTYQVVFNMQGLSYKYSNGGEHHLSANIVAVIKNQRYDIKGTVTLCVYSNGTDILIKVYDVNAVSIDIATNTGTSLNSTSVSIRNGRLIFK